MNWWNRLWRYKVVLVAVATLNNGKVAYTFMENRIGWRKVKRRPVDTSSWRKDDVMLESKSCGFNNIFVASWLSGAKMKEVPSAKDITCDVSQAFSELSGSSLIRKASDVYKNP